MKRLAILLAGLMALAGCGGVEETNRRPDTVRPTIVSLNPCIDAVLVEVADPPQIRALSHWSRDPAASSLPQKVARRFAVTGGTAEEVIALRPDLVLASSFLNPATGDALNRLGIRVETFGIAGSIVESKAQVRRIAALAGHEAAGRRLVARMEATLAGAAPPLGEPPVDTVLWQPGGLVPGQGTLIAELLHRTGFANGADGRGLAQADYLPLEQVLADPPELLLIAGSEAGQDHPVLDTIPTTRRARFDPALLYCGGPTIIQAASRLGALRRNMGEGAR